MTWKAFIDINDYGRTARLNIGDMRQDGSAHILFADPVAIKRYEPGEYIDTETHGVRLPSDDMTGVLQAIMDAAWEKGIRPSQSQADTVNATLGRHLEDMRAIAFHLTKAPLPGAA